MEMRINLVKKIQLSFGIQYIDPTGGFTDILISETHQILHFSGRRDHTNEIYFYMRYGNQYEYISERLKWFADPVLAMKLNLFDKPNIPIKMSVKFSYKNPSGGEDLLPSSSNPDYSLAFLLDYKINKFDFYLNFGRILTSDKETLQSTNVDDFFYGYMVAEYHLTEKSRILIQLSPMQSPYRNNHFKGFKDTPFEILFGVGYKLYDKLGIDLGFTQDLSLAAPEFALNMSLNWSF
jgi:hypothetical protein